MVNGELFPASAIHAAVIVALKDIVPRQVYLFVGNVNEAVEANDGGEVIIPVEGAHFFARVLGEKFCFTNEDQDKGSFGRANTNGLVVLVEHEHAFSGNHRLKNDRVV